MSFMKRLIYVPLAALVLSALGCPQGGGSPSDSPPAEQRVIEGSVRLPDFQNLESLGEGAVFRERPGQDVPVELRRADQPDDVLGQTRTDSEGNWSISVPPKTPLDGSIVAVTSLDDTTLRRAIVTEFGNAITIRAEALSRMLAERSSSPAQIPRARYLNLLSMLATAADLTHPVDWAGDETMETAVERVREAGAADPRLSKRLEQK
jgi:hypothetical protein